MADPRPSPPGPFRPAFWRSPLRGPWLTAVLGAALLGGMSVVAATGFLSNAAYDPRLGANANGRALGPLDFYLFPWPTHPSWLYVLNQGAHVSVGLAVTPIVLAKLWSVVPRLFAWPPARSPAQVLRRLSSALLVGSTLFELVTGILNIQNQYAFRFSFADAHYYGAWVFVAAVAAHIGLHFGTMRRALHTRGLIAPLRQGLAETRPEPRDGLADGLVAVSPDAPTMSRRALLGAVGTGSALLFVQGAGQSIGGPLRRLAFLAPRGRTGSGPNGFPVNRTASVAEISADQVGAGWRLQVRLADRSVSLTRVALLAMPQRSHELPIACVEGWSTTQRWSGVRLTDLAALVGGHGQLTLDAQSIERNGAYAVATLGSGQIADPRAMLALRVNGVDLSLDHGYPARLIVPAAPGVHCTKWVAGLEFRPAEVR